MLAAQHISLADEVCTAKPVIHAERCKGCGICTAFCPEKILSLGKQLNSYGYPTVTMSGERTCRGCLRCHMMCPDVVFTWVS